MTITEIYINEREEDSREKKTKKKVKGENRTEKIGWQDKKYK